MIRVIKVNNLRGDDRKGVVYVGRAFAGWPAHPLGNPFRPLRNELPGSALRHYRDWIEKRSQRDKLLADLWEQTKHGSLPLGCWCVDATAGDGSPLVCHAQILAELLSERFGSERRVWPGIG